MNVICGQIPSGFAIDEVSPGSSRLWHRREVRPRSESDLHQTSQLQVVLPNVREPVYRAAEENGFSLLAQYDIKGIPGKPRHLSSGHLPQVNLFVAGYVDPVETEIG